MSATTRTGGRKATSAIIPGRLALSVGDPGAQTPPGFTWTSLSAVARLESGHTPSRDHPEYWDGGVPWIGIRDATENHGLVIMDTHQHVSTLGIENSSARVLPAGTVCLSRTASVGYVVVMGSPMATSQDFVNWVCGPSLSNRYLAYLLQSEQDFIRTVAYGTTHKTLYYPDAKALHVMIPSRDAQDRVVDILGALDDKIAANRKIVDKCDALATALFDVMSLEERRPLSSVARFVNGRAFTKDASGTGRMVVRIAELNSGPGGSTIYNDIQVDDDNLARPGDLLFSWSGSLVVRRWFYPEAIVNQHIFKVLPRLGYPTWLVAQLIERSLEYFRGIAADKTTTMGHIQRRHLDEPVDVPDHTVIAAHDGPMRGLWNRALAAEQESLTLAALRDTLLPPLMSGRLTVRDAESTLEKVL